MPLIAVGDDKQEIYSYTGASFDITREMQSYLDDVVEFGMPINYRSTKAIVGYANNLMTHGCANDFSGSIPRPNAPQGDPVTIMAAPTYEEEVEYIAKQIKEQELDLDECLILARTNTQVSIVSQTLKELDIPHKVMGENWTFWDKKHIKIALAYLELEDNGGDAETLSTILNVPSSDYIKPFGKGQGSYYPSRYIKVKKFVGKFGNLRQAAESIGSLSRPEKRGVEDMMSMIEKMSTSDTIPGKIDAMSESIFKYFRHTKGLPPAVTDDIERLQVMSKRFKSLSSMMSFINQARADADRQLRGAAVSVGTIHSAKGLEYDFVFVTGCCEGQPDLAGNIKYSSIPNRYAFVDPESKGVVYGSRKAEIEEERRVFYVAITRPRTKLYLTWHVKYGDHECKRSRFIDQSLRSAGEIADN